MAIQFGVGELQVSATAAHTVGKLQNVSFNISYENALMRGGSDVFACDFQAYDGSIEGSFEHGDITLSAIGNIIASTGDWTDNATTSGVLTMTGESKPTVFKLVFSGVTNGVTSTITLQRVYCPGLTLDFSRTDYMIPSMNFVAVYSTASGMLTWQM